MAGIHSTSPRLKAGGRAGGRGGPGKSTAAQTHKRVGKAVRFATSLWWRSSQLISQVVTCTSSSEGRVAQAFRCTSRRQRVQFRATCPRYTSTNCSCNCLYSRCSFHRCAACFRRPRRCMRAAESSPAAAAAAPARHCDRCRHKRPRRQHSRVTAQQCPALCLLPLLPHCVGRRPPPHTRTPPHPPTHPPAGRLGTCAPRCGCTAASRRRHTP